MRQYIDTLQDIQGNALVGATVLVQNYVGGANASIFSDNGLSPIVTSTVATGSDGQFSFYAADGDYNLVMSKNATVFKTQSPVSLFDGAAQLTYADTGSANAYAIANNTLEKALRTGLRCSVQIANANTGASTLSYNSLVAKPIIFPGGAAIGGGVLVATGIYRFEYDGTNWQVQNESVALPLYLQTVAETAAGVTPTFTSFIEGDIRRYGALTASADNHVAITAALSVSGAGGNPAFIPGGTWKTTTAPVAAPGSSMYGTGTASIINPSNGIDGLQFTASDSGIVARSRFFRDFQIQGTLSGSTNTGAHGIYINPTVVSHVDFQNLSILNFEFGAYVTNLYYSVFLNCFIQNCYQGIYFKNQSVVIWILDCTIQLTSPGTLITGAGTSNGISVQGAPALETLHIQGGSIYGFNYDINLGLIFECHILGVDVSFATICPIFFTSTVDGLWIEDCWVELASTASGTWNTAGTGTGNLTGIFITAITPSTSAKVHIHRNYINSDVTIGGSTGLYLGNSNNGINCTGNHIIGFDIGISGGNTLTNPGFTLAGASIKNNTVNAATSGILLTSACTELELGPNYMLTAATPYSFSGGAPTSMTYNQPNAPMKGTASFAAATTAAVAFTNAMPFSTYRIALSQSASSALPPWWTAKTVSGFTINFSAAFTGTVDWSISA